jgi:hypothetical protein
MKIFPAPSHTGGVVAKYRTSPAATGAFSSTLSASLETSCARLHGKIRRISAKAKQGL